MKKTIKTLMISVLAVCVIIFALSIGFQNSGIYINTTPSLPLGFYRIVDEPILSGAYVAFCPPQDVVFDMAMDRHFINRGDCPGCYGLLLKNVYAQSGDTVSINQLKLYLTGKLL